MSRFTALLTVRSELVTLAIITGVSIGLSYILLFITLFCCDVIRRFRFLIFYK